MTPLLLAEEFLLDEEEELIDPEDRRELLSFLFADVSFPLCGETNVPSLLPEVAAPFPPAAVVVVVLSDTFAAVFADVDELVFAAVEPDDGNTEAASV